MFNWDILNSTGGTGKIELSRSVEQTAQKDSEWQQR